MPRLSAPPPPESVREWLTAKDGLLYWNKEKVTHGRMKEGEPVRGYDLERPTILIQGRTYDLCRLNYWFHTGEWPVCVIPKDHDRGNWHIDNLMPATAQQSNQHRQWVKRTYCITERISKRGKRSYYAYLTFNDKSKAVGRYNSESQAIAAAIKMRQLLHGEYLAEDIKESFKHTK